MRFDEQFIREALSQVDIVGSKTLHEPQFSIDTRTLQAGDIFVALKGVNHDGHDFIADAFAKGAAGALVATEKKDVLSKIDQKKVNESLVLLVPDVLKALVDLAHAWRARFDYPVIAITGSVGKTTTKAILSHILERNGTPHVASQENQNTLIGASLNLLRMRAEHKAAIIEVGVNKRGEMAQLAKLVVPTTAIITNVGHCHMEGLGSFNDVAAEKRAVFSCFSEDSIGIVNGDQPLLAQVAYPHPVIKFGSKTTNQIQARKIVMNNTQTNFVLKIYRKKYQVKLLKAHRGAVENSLAATAAAHLLGVSDEVIVKAIQEPLRVVGRFEERNLKAAQGTLIDDCYNANPESMKAALLAFQRMETEATKIAVLGDMLELGVNSPFWHRQLGRFLRKVPSLERVILVGDMIQWTKKTVPAGLTVDVVPTWHEAVEKLKGCLNQESVVLVKGSLGVGLKNLVDTFTEEKQ